MRLVPESVSSTIGQECDRSLIRLADAASQFGRSLRFATWLLLAVFVASTFLDFGIWTPQETFRGPFRVADSTTGLYAVEIGAGVPFWLGMRLVNTEPWRHKRNPQLGVDGHAIDLPAIPRVKFASGASIWLGLAPRALLFPLPAGVANDRRIELAVTYTVQFHSSFQDITLWGLAIVLLLQLRQIWRTATIVRAWLIAKAPAWTVPLDAAAAVFFPTVSYAVIAASAIYVASIGYGVLRADALPAATIFTLAPSWLATTIEPVLPAAILLFAALGAMFAWTGCLRVVPALSLRRTEATLVRLCGWCGLPVIACLLLFSLSAGGWSGHVRPYDQNYMSVAGLVANSDARAYFTDVYQQALWGDWGMSGSRRPLGEAFRELVVVAAQYSYVEALLIQLALVSVALFVAARTLVRWFGIWSGVAFVGFVWILCRAFLTTMLTEPLALVCTLFSIVFLLDALRLRSLPHALVALAGLTFALMIRMGSMFLLPFMALWIATSFASALRARLRLFALACSVVIAVVAINALIAWLYASPAVSTGSNFAWTLCGLAHGSYWAECNHLYARELAQLPDEKAQAMFLLAQSWDNILHHPTVFLLRLADNGRDFIEQLPQFVLQGYGRYKPYSVSATFSEIAFFAMSALAVSALRRRRNTLAIGFWVVLFASTCMSAAIVLGDDGWRVLMVTNVLITCFLAIGFASPAAAAHATVTPVTPSWRWQTGVGMIAGVTLLAFVVPMLSHAIAMREIAGPAPAGARANEVVVPGRRFISGFVVVPDGTSRPLTVPSMFASDFVDMVRQVNLEGDLGPFLQTVMGRLPFAFIVAGSLDERNQSHVYIAPPFVLERRDVRAWRFMLRPWRPDETPWVTLQDVTTAEPVP